MATIDNEKDPLIAKAVSAIMASHYTLGSLSAYPDGFGPKSIAEMAEDAIDCLNDALSFLGYSEEDIHDMAVDLSAKVAEGIAAGPARRWEPYVDDDCSGNTPIRSR